MNIVNLTPHAVVLRNENGEDLVIEATTPPARVATTSVPTGDIVAGLPTYRTQYGEIEGLPAPQPGTAYIVSMLVLGRCHGRMDVFAPATGPKDGAVRNEAGHVVAVTRLIAADLCPERDRFVGECGCDHVIVHSPLYQVLERFEDL